MKVVIFLFFLFCFVKMNLFAQQQESLPTNCFGIGIGYHIDAVKDTNLSPLQQKGTSFGYSIFYEKHSENILKVAVSYYDAVLKSARSNRIETSFYNGQVGITYLKGLTSIQQNTKLYLGGAYQLNVLYIDWNEQDAFSYLSVNGFSVSAAVSRQFTSRSYLESSVSIPIFQWVSRPPYNGLDEEIIENQDEPLKIVLQGEFASFKEYKSLSWNVNYSYEIFPHFNCKVAYDFKIQKVSKTHTFTSLSNNISTSILYTF